MLYTMYASISTANGRQNGTDRRRADRNLIAYAPDKRSRDTCGLENNRVPGGGGSGRLILLPWYNRTLFIGRLGQSSGTRINRAIWSGPVGPVYGRTTTGMRTGNLTQPRLSSAASGPVVRFSVATFADSRPLSGDKASRTPDGHRCGPNPPRGP